MKKILALLLALVLLLSLAACGTGGDTGGNGAATNIRPYSVEGTISGNILTYATNDTTTTPGKTIPVNWSDSPEEAQKWEVPTLNGICRLEIPTNGGENIDGDKWLSAIHLTFYKNGNEVTLPGSINFQYFRADGYSFTFVPNYFDEGDIVTIIADFTYQGDGIWGKIVGFANPQVKKGYYLFEVGEDLGLRLIGGNNVDANAAESDGDSGEATTNSGDGFFSGITNWGQNLLGTITSGGDILTGIKTGWNDFWNGIQGSITDVTGDLAAKGEELMDDLQGMAGEIQNNIEDIANGDYGKITEDLTIEWNTDSTQYELAENEPNATLYSSEFHSGGWHDELRYASPDDKILLFAKTNELKAKYEFDDAQLTLRGIYDAKTGERITTFSNEKVDNFIVEDDATSPTSDSRTIEDKVDEYISVSPISLMAQTEVNEEAFVYYIPRLEQLANDLNKLQDPEVEPFHFEDHIGHVLKFEVTLIGKAHPDYAKENNLNNIYYKKTMFFYVEIVSNDWWKDRDNASVTDTTPTTEGTTPTEGGE